MADFLLTLGKMNLAMGAAIVLIWLLRRPVRALFQTQIGYMLWILVPIAGLASLLPPRVAPALSSMPVQMTQSVLAAGTYATSQSPMTPSVAHLGARIPEHVADFQTMMTTHNTAFDFQTSLFYAWALGAMLMVVYLARLQARFHATASRGEAGPAIMGFWRPRLVMPTDFSMQYTAPEQAAILAHERVHLERQDSRINALAALARCICWFNPLMHLGARWMRIDQELACDAAVLDRDISRRDYAQALLKTQMIVTLLPLGCAWPSSEHPLAERITLLKRKHPGTGRRAIGMASVVFAGALMGLGAWATEPPATAAPTLPRTETHVQAAIAPAIDAAKNIGSGKAVAMAQNQIEAPVTAAPTLLTPAESSSAAQEIHITADRNDDDVNARTVTYTGNVIISQGDIRAHADQVKFDSRSNKIYANGSVTAASPTTGTATFDNGVYDLARKLMTLSGHVVVNRPGQGTMRGSLLTMNIVTGEIHVSGAPVAGTLDQTSAPGTPDGRVQTIITPAGHQVTETR